MASISPFRIELSTAQRAELERRSRDYTDPYFRVVRAKIVLMAADSLENIEIAAPGGMAARQTLVPCRRDRAFTFVWVSLLLAAPVLAFHDTTLLRVASLPVVIGLCVFLLVGVYNTRSRDS